MLRELEIDRFGLHDHIAFACGTLNVFLGPNGSGKSHLLSSLDLLLGGVSHTKKTVQHALHEHSRLRGVFVRNIPVETTVTYTESPRAMLRFSLQGQPLSRAKYLEKLPYRPIVFSPLDVRILYGSPEWRREFLDSILSVAFAQFDDTRKKYTKILRTRNKLLKLIAEHKGSPSDLDMWDRMLCDEAERYYQYRMRISEFFRVHITKIAHLLQREYELDWLYETKTDLQDIRGSIGEYLSRNRDRDIMLGHTYIWPHLDDFSLGVCTKHDRIASAEYLSFGENKTLFIGLLLSALDFLEENVHGVSVIALLDDIFSELDVHHQDTLLSRLSEHQVFISCQTLPKSLVDRQDLTILDLYTKI